MTNRALRLPLPLLRAIARAAQALVQPNTHTRIDFSVPPGEAALAASDSMSWHVFRNPISLFIGGVAAVILELAEPSVRAGFWERLGIPPESLLV